LWQIYLGKFCNTRTFYYIIFYGALCVCVHTFAFLYCKINIIMLCAIMTFINQKMRIIKNNLYNGIMKKILFKKFYEYTIQKLNKTLILFSNVREYFSHLILWKNEKCIILFFEYPLTLYNKQLWKKKKNNFSWKNNLL
jgi:hypothetical protein